MAMIKVNLQGSVGYQGVYYTGQKGGTLVPPGLARSLGLEAIEDEASAARERAAPRPAEGSLGSLGLGPRQIAALRDAGYKDAEAARAASDEQLLALNGIGVGSIKLIRGGG